MRHIGLKVDVDTLRGTLEGVPNLVRLLKSYGVGATFLFSLGPDHTGRAIRRVFRRGFLSKVRRTSVAAHYGLKTLSYGVLLPGPNIAKRGRDVMRHVRDEGFEVGVHCHDHVLWQDNVAQRNREWTRKQMSLAIDAFQDVFHEMPKVHGAAGWQVNRFVPELERELGFEYASDTRGTHPFIPEAQSAQQVCAQLPTTLPTLDELIGRDGANEDNVHSALLHESLKPAQGEQVFTLHAELEGMRLQPILSRLLENWRAEGFELSDLRTLYQAALRRDLPPGRIGYLEIPGRAGQLAVQQPLLGDSGISTTYEVA